MPFKELFAAVAAASFVAISQLAAASNLNRYHRMAVVVFFIVMPISVVGFVSNDQLNAKPFWIIRLMAGASGGLFVGAVTLLARSFDRSAGCAFVLTVIALA